jgi:glycosyltransferase involved in cell wall biosynthesis
MCSSLAKSGLYDVSLVVADNNGDETKNNVNIFDAGKAGGGRFARITQTVKRVYSKAKELDSDLYHIHDPELLPIGLKLKRLGKIVIFDAHEDAPKQMLSKPYLNPFLLKIISKSLAFYEAYTCKRFDGIITATPFIKDKFMKINKRSLDINNYPVLGELLSEVDWESKENKICYVGAISEIRGIKQAVEAFDKTELAKLLLVGEFNEPALKEEVSSYKGWRNIVEVGFLSRGDVSEIMGKSKAGLVTFLPVPNHVYAQPNKMFEYMSAGLPVIGSNFHYWKEIIEGNNCGICVNPTDPSSIAEGVDYILSNPDEAKQMGENGRQAVVEKYNWGKEEEKLIRFYKELLN